MDITMNGTEKKVEALIVLVEAMANKIEYLEKRIKLLEYLTDADDKELELYRTGGMGK
jgi:hypothetical protein